MSIQDVVDALFDLPPEKIKEPEHPPQKASWKVVHGRIGGVLFMMAGRVTERGEWRIAEIVASVWPPNEAWKDSNMVRENTPGFLPQPIVTFDREGSHVVSAYMKLREGVKAAGCVQPNPDALVFFFVAADGLPVGIRFHEPASGVAVCALVDSLVEGSSGPTGVERAAQHHFFTEPNELRAFLRALRETIVGLEDHSSSDTCSR